MSGFKSIGFAASAVSGKREKVIDDTKGASDQGAFLVFTAYMIDHFVAEIPNPPRRVRQQRGPEGPRCCCFSSS